MAGFDIDDRKLSSALPPPTSEGTEDMKWVSAFLIVFGLAAAVVVGVVIWVLSKLL